MTLAAMQPILKAAELMMWKIANLFGGMLAAWWLTILTVGPLRRQQGTGNEFEVLESAIGEQLGFTASLETRVGEKLGHLAKTGCRVG